MAVTRQTGGGTTTYSYYATDHLGTVRCTLTTDSNGVEQSRTFHDFEPFGLEIPVKDTTSTNTHRFTGQERDPATGNDYMHFRFYGSVMGRFYKPDKGADQHLYEPQTWNLYSYVFDRPVTANDPNGQTFVLSDNEAKRNEQLALIKKSLQNSEAARHVTAVQQNGQWIVSIQGISGGDFNKLGTSAQGLNHLVSSVNDYKLDLGPSKQAADHGGAFTENKTIYLDPSMFPSQKGQVKETAATALTHETGHLLENEFSDTFVHSFWNKSIRTQKNHNEGYAMNYENAVRREAGLPERQYYETQGDFFSLDETPLFPR